MDPVLAYGWSLHLEEIAEQTRLELITPDDAVGTSLLRPQPPSGNVGDTLLASHSAVNVHLNGTVMVFIRPA